MDERTAKILAPIKKICNKIKSEDEIDVYVKELIKNITTLNAAFYHFQTLSLLLEILKENRDLNATKIRHIFKVLDHILNSNISKKSKQSCAIAFYNYFIGLKEVN